MKQKVLVVGAGPIAREYISILRSLNREIVVVGRGETNCSKLKKEFHNESIIHSGGIEKYLENNSLRQENFSHSIIAVSEENLGVILNKLLTAGFDNILAEKPGGITFNEVIDIYNRFKDRKVFIAYNRRFYSSVINAKKIIYSDGGITSFQFDFTELYHLFVPLNKPKIVIDNLFFGNSTHVLDMAFFICGKPKKLMSQIHGGTNWHPDGAIFTGAGITKNNVPFTYHANWDAPGRWGVEIYTKNHKLIFQPLEELRIQNKGEFKIETQKANKLDIDYKPGYYLEMKAFIDGENRSSLCTLREQVETIEWYEKILEGNNV